MSGCAYCGKPGPLTKEHVAPSFLYKANPGSDFGFNLRAGRFISGETQIKDVCSICNNEHLSQLDQYARDFYVQNGIHCLVTVEKTIRLRYDFLLLSRFLLKVTYNCLRYKAQDEEWLVPFRDYILHGSKRPIRPAMKIGVEVTPCQKITETQRARLPESLKNSEYMPTHSIRVGQVGGIRSAKVFAR